MTVQQRSWAPVHTPVDSLAQLGACPKESDTAIISPVRCPAPLGGHHVTCVHRTGRSNGHINLMVNSPVAKPCRWRAAGGGGGGGGADGRGDLVNIPMLSVVRMSACWGYVAPTFIRCT